MQDFKNLAVWQAARRLTKSVYQPLSALIEVKRMSSGLTGRLC